MPWNVDDYDSGVGTLTMDGDPIDGILEFTVNPTERQFIPVRHSGLTDKVEQKVPAWRVMTTATLRCVYQTDLFTALTNKSATDDTVTLVWTPEGGTAKTMLAYVHEPNVSAPVDGSDVNTFEVVFELTGGAQGGS